MTAPVAFPQLQNARATANLLEQLGITAPIRFDVITSVIPVAIISDVDPTLKDKLAYGFGIQAAVAAENAHIQLFNPATSGVIVHVDSCIVSAIVNATNCLLAEFDTPITTNLSTLGYRDRRVAGSPVAQVRRQSNAGTLGADRLSFRIGATDTILIPVDTFLGPGEGVLVVLETAQTEINCSWYWEELPPVGKG